MNPLEFSHIARAEEGFWWFRGMRRIAWALLDPLIARHKPRRALDAGCGTGHFAREIERRYQIPVTAVDIGAEGVAIGKRLGVERLAQADVTALPFAAATFDLLLSMDVLVHFPRGGEAAALSEFARVLAPGGLALIRVSALDALHSRHTSWARERQRFTRPRLIEALTRGGLHVKRCTYANSLLMPVAFAKFRLIEPLLGGEPRSGVEPVSPWLDATLHRALAAEAKLIGAGIDLPLGQSLIVIAGRE